LGSLREAMLAALNGDRDFMKIPALDWIIEYLESNTIPYVVCGGLAAQAYGSTRDLADVDIYVPDEYLYQIVQMGKNYVTYGPARYVDDEWDLTFVQFEFENQKVEIASDKECKILDSEIGEWHQEIIDFNQYKVCYIYDRPIKVMKKDDLISYKRKLNRQVDIEDIKQIQQSV